jgi:hypothetical protein
MRLYAVPFYEREIWLKNRFDALFKPVMGKIYDTKASQNPAEKQNEPARALVLCHAVRPTNLSG